MRASVERRDEKFLKISKYRRCAIPRRLEPLATIGAREQRKAVRPIDLLQSRDFRARHPGAKHGRVCLQYPPCTVGGPGVHLDESDLAHRLSPSSNGRAGRERRRASQNGSGNADGAGEPEEGPAGREEAAPR